MTKPMFTRRHHITIARVVSESWIPETINNPNAKFENCGVAELRRNLANMLQDDNPAFDRAKFFAACK